MNDIAQQRILKGQCPRCGQEAAPYRLCWSHRMEARLVNHLKRGAKHEVYRFEKEGGKVYWYLSAKAEDQDALRQLDKWATPLALRETDRRSRPRIRGISVDVEATLYEVIKRLGRPSTIEEITAAWGRLRDRRHGSLATDLSQIIAAQDKRTRKMLKRASHAVAK